MFNKLKTAIDTIEYINVINNQPIAEALLYEINTSLCDIDIIPIDYYYDFHDINITIKTTCDVCSKPDINVLLICQDYNVRTITVNITIFGQSYYKIFKYINID